MLNGYVDILKYVDLYPDSSEDTVIQRAELLPLEQRILADAPLASQLELLELGARIRPFFRLSVENFNPWSYRLESYSNDWQPLNLCLIQDGVKLAYIKKRCEVFLEKDEGNLIQKNHISRILEILRNESVDSKQKLHSINLRLRKGGALNSALQKSSKSHCAFLALIALIAVITLGIGALVAVCVEKKKTFGISCAFWKSPSKKLLKELSFISSEVAPRRTEMKELAVGS